MIKRLLIKIAYRILLKYSYDFMPYFFSGDVYKVTSTSMSFDQYNKKTILTITAEREWR